MKITNIIATALAGLAALPVVAQDSKPQAGDILRDINMFNPEDGDPAYKVKANEKAGTQWGVDLAYGYWHTHRATTDTNHHNNFALLHAQLNQRLIRHEADGGTWLRVEVSGSWALDPRSVRSNSGDTYVEGFGAGTCAHPDIMGPHDLFLPEVALMHYFAGKRACIIAGVVNLTNYFDTVGIANDSFSSFVNSGFVNSSILPLADSNAGAILQVELSRRSYVMAAVSRTGVEPGYNPFRGESDGYCVVGEYGHTLGDGAAVLRLTPFFSVVDEAADAGTRHRRNAGLVGSIECTPCETVTLYARAGFGAKPYMGNSAELSVGASVALIPSREDDFFGISWGVFKCAAPHEGEEGEHGRPRESVLELMYSLQVTDYFKIVPHYEHIHNAAYRNCRDASVWGVQGVFSF